MHANSIDPWTHEHVYLGDRHDHRERRTWAVVGVTAAMMVVEIVGGTLYGSMALVADGWHMSTHAAALAIAALAYRLARRHAHDRRFTFGTGKLGDLAAFANAIILAMIALYIGLESAGRLFQPVTIEFSEAIPIAIAGLAVNLGSVWLLHDAGHHGHRHDHHDHHDHHHGHHDHHDHHGHVEHDTNYRAAYLHVFADALTSVLAILALLGGLIYGWTWLDPVMGLVGTVVIAAWSFGLVKSSGAVLLDTVPAPGLEAEIRGRLEIQGDRVSDCHIWRIGPGHRAAVISIVTHAPKPPAAYKARVADLPELSHVTVEVQTCPDAPHVAERAGNPFPSVH